MTNPRDSCRSTVVDGFLVGRYLAFADDFRVNKDCVRRWNQASAVEEV
jgi:hypothetical protein